MSERYSKLFSLPENLYAAGSPVVIAAGALLKDNQTGKVLAQLKLRNISKETIKAATVSVEPLDTVGQPLGEPVTYQYLDLHADRDADFGQKTPVALPDSATRSFAVSVVQVIFTDNSIWNADSEEWKPLGRPHPLDALGDSELTKQFRIEYGGGCKNLLLEQKDLWHCVCGGVNHQEEANCHKCGKALLELQAIDMEDLGKKKDERVAKEQAEADAARIEAQKKAERTAVKAKKIGKIAAILAVVIAIAAFITGMIQKNNDYKQAVALLENKRYGEAAQAFAALGNYKDSAAKREIAEVQGEETFIRLMNTSIQEAYEWGSLLTDPSDEAKKLLAICEEYKPYCGTYTWEGMDGRILDAFSFKSDFYVEGDSVYWVYDDSEYTFFPTFSVDYCNPKLGRNGEKYEFLRNPLPVEDSAVYEWITDDLIDLKVVFKDGQIKMTMGGFTAETTDNSFIVRKEMHADLFTLMAARAGE